jgi:thiosulfate/3-mercaptopyruvate sulfurtransferase
MEARTSVRIGVWIAYCRIGERSAHTWFVLHELLGYPSVENYDGSWTEYGSLVGVPVER